MGAVEVVTRVADAVMTNVGRAIVNKDEEIRFCLVTLLCEGHLLIEDVPGVGKTMLAKALSRSIGCSFRRIQFTPDLLPSDVTGLSIFNQKTQEFEFRPGPIMAQVVLADEINRATPKTQSALLECMEERQATIDGVSHTVYVRLTQIRGESGEPVRAFVRRMFVSADSADARRLVIDLRSITGSDARLAVPLVRGIVTRDRFTKGGGLYLVVGPDSFTRTQTVATLLQRYANPTLVHELP